MRFLKQKSNDNKIFSILTLENNGGRKRFKSLVNLPVAKNLLIEAGECVGKTL